jgi:hypothetical protein
MAASIPVFESLPADFYEKHVVARRPAVLRGGASHWPAVGKWTPSWLRAHLGDRTLSMAWSFTEHVDYALGRFLEAIEGDAGQVPYLRNVFLHVELPELSADVGELEWAKPNWFQKEPFVSMIRAGCPQWIDWCELFISRGGTRFPIVHVDRNMTHAWCVQIYGEKRYWAWPPRAGFEAVECLGRDLETLFPDAPASAVVEAGDALFIPAGWPHTAESVTTSISLSGNFVNESNWHDFAPVFFAGDLFTVMRGP